VLLFIITGDTERKTKELDAMNPNMKEMMRQAQILQNKIAKTQEELAKKTIEVSVGGGMVKAVANGKPEIVSLSIEKEVVDPEDVEMLQDLVVAAVNEALSRSKEMVDSEMAKITGGLKMPGLF
jgi:DNA-binding YbaB/EbfC family protein